MRRMLSTLLIALLALYALTAQAPTISALKGKKVQLTLWTHEDANRTPLEKGLIAEFTAANP